MIATKKVCFGLFAAVLFFPVAAFSQITAPAPISDTAKRADTTKKPIFTLRTLGIAPLYVFEMNDNAKINAEHQFPGARALPDSCYYPGERHLKNIRQLTFEGANSRPSISPDDRYLAFQAHGNKPNSCDQIYRMPLGAAIPAERISSGQGRATGAAFLDADHILYTSTQAINNGACPPDPSEADVWPLDRGTALYISDTNGKLVRRLTNDMASYDGDATVSPNGDHILFTSTRKGDIELFSMKPDGSDVARLTHVEDYNSAASFSPNGAETAYCDPNAYERIKFRKLTEQYLPKPPQLEIYVMNANASKERQVTHLGGVSCNPCLAPDGEHIIFSSNYLDPTHRAFDLFMIKNDGTGLERITYGGGFNGFPVFTRDGKLLVFCSSRNASHPTDVNIFVADWVQ